MPCNAIAFHPIKFGFWFWCFYRVSHLTFCVSNVMCHWKLWCFMCNVLSQNLILFILLSLLLCSNLNNHHNALECNYFGWFFLSLCATLKSNKFTIFFLENKEHPKSFTKIKSDVIKIRHMTKWTNQIWFLFKWLLSSSLSHQIEFYSRKHLQLTSNIDETSRITNKYQINVSKY